VAAGDAGGEVVGGFRKMDREQSHYHNPNPATVNGYLQNGAGTLTIGAGAGSSLQTTTGAPVSDLVNGTPRTGKTTDPRTAGQYAYTWGAVYIP